MSGNSKRVTWLGGAVKSPPMSEKARKWIGRLIRAVQDGDFLTMPDSRPMRAVGERCHELRIGDGDVDWRVIYRIDPDAVLIVEVFNKTSQATPKHIIETCRWRLKRHDHAAKTR